MIEEALGVSQHEAIEHYIDTPNASAYYRKAFEQYNQEEGFVSIWSWWAFIFGFVFLIYRKLYTEAYVATIPLIATFIIIFFGLFGLSSYLIITLLLSAIIYKKLYKTLQIYLILKIIIFYLTLTHPIFILIYFLLDGLFALFFAYKRYQRVLTTAQEYDVKEEELLISLKDLGGINRWAFAFIPLWALVHHSYLYALYFYFIIKSAMTP